MENEVGPMQTLDLQKIAETEFERMGGSVDRLIYQHVSEYKFITSTLLLLNSGTAVALLNSDYVTLDGKREACVLCIIGVLAALAVSWLSQIFTQRMIGPTEQYRVFWLMIARGQTFEAEKEASLRKDMIDKRGHFVWIIPAVGWISLGLFVGSATVAGSNLVSKDKQPAPITQVTKPITKATK